MIITQLLGGMGNQMFQYAVARHLSVLNKSELKLDTSVLLDWSPGRHAVNRGYDLDIFNVNSSIANKKDIAGYNSQLMTLPEKVIFKLKKKLTGDKVTSEPHFHFDADILKKRGDIYLTGTWQSYKYFEEIAGIIREDFSFKAPPTEKARTMIDKINSGVAVCLNVRRTDYVNVQVTKDILGFIGIEYYKRALALMADKVKGFTVYIFSDDLDWCKENLSFIEHPVEFVGHEYAGRKFSDYLLLMSCCNHYIIPNSTFAWWGAWLNASADKIVITPEKWMNDPEMITQDLIPKEWIKI